MELRVISAYLRAASLLAIRIQSTREMRLTLDRYLTIYSYPCRPSIHLKNSPPIDSSPTNEKPSPITTSPIPQLLFPQPFSARPHHHLHAQVTDEHPIKH